MIVSSSDTAACRWLSRRSDSHGWTCELKRGCTDESYSLWVDNHAKIIVVDIALGLMLRCRLCQTALAESDTASCMTRPAIQIRCFDLKYALKYTICHAPRPANIPMVPKANHLTLSFVLSFVSLNFCSLILRYSISVTISFTFSSILRSSVSTGLSFSAAWTADQSRASAPISMSSST